MKTGNLKYTRNFYDLDTISIDKEKRVYKIKYRSEHTNELFTNIVKVEKDNGFHDRSRFFEYWLLFRDETNWHRCTKTGLANTNKRFVFEGNISELVILNTKTLKGKDWENPKHFVIVQFSKDSQTLIIDIFKDFYPHKPELINLIIKDHNFIFNTPYLEVKTA